MSAGAGTGGPRAHRRAIALMIAAATLWSIAGVLTRQLDFAGRWEVTFWRSFFSLASSCSPCWACVRTRGAVRKDLLQIESCDRPIGEA